MLCNIELFRYEPSVEETYILASTELDEEIEILINKNGEWSYL